MHTVTSFHASAVKPDQLSEIMAAYLALEHARILRRLLVKRFALLAAVVAAVGVVSLPAPASWFAVALCVAVPAWAWIVELRYELRLVRRLDDVPAARQKVIKSS